MDRGAAADRGARRSRGRRGGAQQQQVHRAAQERDASTSPETGPDHLPLGADRQVDERRPDLRVRQKGAPGELFGLRTWDTPGSLAILEQHPKGRTPTSRSTSRTPTALSRSGRALGRRGTQPTQLFAQRLPDSPKREEPLPRRQLFLQLRELSTRSPPHVRQRQRLSAMASALGEDVAPLLRDVRASRKRKTGRERDLLRGRRRGGYLESDRHQSLGSPLYIGADVQGSQNARRRRGRGARREDALDAWQVGVLYGIISPPPSAVPTALPTSVPTGLPTPLPSPVPTTGPTGLLTTVPTPGPSPQPTNVPTGMPTTARPTALPSIAPTVSPAPTSHWFQGSLIAYYDFADGTTHDIYQGWEHARRPWPRPRAGTVVTAIALDHGAAVTLPPEATQDGLGDGRPDCVHVGANRRVERWVLVLLRRRRFAGDQQRRRRGRIGCGHRGRDVLSYPTRTWRRTAGSAEAAALAARAGTCKAPTSVIGARSRAAPTARGSRRP